jgi:spore germination protein YaaH
VISTEANRAAHAERLTDLVVSKGYDGLDLDYESRRAEDRDEFSLFVETLASRLHAEDKKLAIAVHAKTSEPGGWSGAKAQDWKRLGRAADEFKIMLYDYHWNGSEAGPAAPPGWIDEVLTFAETRVAPYKIRMGLPFYGRDWRGTEARDLVYTEVRQLAEERSATMQRHSSGEPYFKYSDDHTVYYQDSRSIGMKLEVLKRKHPKVGGIAVWHVGGESRDYWTTLKNKLER